MKTRLIGADQVGELGLGCMGMSGAYGPADRDEAVATIHLALDSGVTMLDTADMYGRGKNETLVGAAIANRRDDVFLATKTGILTWPGLGLPRGRNGRPEYIRRSLDAGGGR